MTEYKVYFVDSTGHFMDREDIECADDEAATARATEIACGIEAELWCGARRVAVLKGRRFPQPTSDAEGPRKLD
jgi:hypothetical protein